MGWFEQASFMYFRLLKTSRFRETLRMGGNARGELRKECQVLRTGAAIHVGNVLGQHEVRAWQLETHTSEHSKASASGRRIQEDHHLTAAPRQTPPQGLFVHYLRGTVLSLPAQVLGGPLPPGGVSPTIISTGTCTTTLRGGFCGKRPIL